MKNTLKSSGWVFLPNASKKQYYEKQEYLKYLGREIELKSYYGYLIYQLSKQSIQRIQCRVMSFIKKTLIPFLDNKDQSTP